jgi:hypothetical protein
MAHDHTIIAASGTSDLYPGLPIKSSGTKASKAARIMDSTTLDLVSDEPVDKFMDMLVDMLGRPTHAHVVEAPSMLVLFWTDNPILSDETKLAEFLRANKGDSDGKLESVVQRWIDLHPRALGLTGGESEQPRRWRISLGGSQRQRLNRSVEITVLD